MPYNSSSSSSNFMLEALSQAKLAFEAHEVPVGCIITYNNQIIAKSHNLTKANKDHTAHAEILAIRTACNALKSATLENCDIFITLEPCPMCLMAISYTRIKRIYYGANDEKFGAIESNPLYNFKNLAIFKSEIYSGINAEESKLLLQQFFKNKR
ncbi:MAG: nucleoside deaminase [Rickettsiales bacterium]